jgi:hypothetical protein
VNHATINDRIYEHLNNYFRLNGNAKPEISTDALRVAKELGLEKCLFEKEYIENPDIIHPRGLIKDFYPLRDSGILKGILLFGSLKKGHYVDDLSTYENIEKQLVTSEQNFWHHSFIGDMFNYPYGSDVDFCFIVEDEYYTLSPEKIKSDFSTILLNYPKYYFEHFSVIPKYQLYKLMEEFDPFRLKKIQNENFDLLFFKINPDYYPTGIKESAKEELVKKRQEHEKKLGTLRDKLELLKELYKNDEIKSKMIEYSLNRINSGVTCEREDSFGHERVLKSLPRSFFLNFDPSFLHSIKNINNYSIISNSFETYLSSFEKELKEQELKNNTRMNKWHFMKEFRNYYLKKTISKNKYKV